MIIDYIKLSPTGNITILVKNPVPRSAQPALAATLLHMIGGEQVGYIETPANPRARARLQMMGGEFCGNATMSLGAYLARCDGVQAADYQLEVSSAAALVSCRIVREGDLFTGTVNMPRPRRIREVALDAPGRTLHVHAVETEGITHLILPTSLGVTEEMLRGLMPGWCGQLGAEALGALTWHADTHFMDPLVYVPAAGTLVREHGCGSGSAAIGCFIAASQGGRCSVAIDQPGGAIRVDVDEPRAVLTITGRVCILEESTVTVAGRLGE